MNQIKIRRLVKRLRLPQTQGHFDLSTWFFNMDSAKPIQGQMHNCGTTACIAGWAIANESESISENQILDRGGYAACAGDILGLTVDQAHALFTPNSSTLVNYERVTPLIAADVLERLAETGEVVWPEEVRP